MAKLINDFDSGERHDDKELFFFFRDFISKTFKK